MHFTLAQFVLDIPEEDIPAADSFNFELAECRACVHLTCYLQMCSMYNSTNPPEWALPSLILVPFGSQPNEHNPPTFKYEQGIIDQLHLHTSSLYMYNNLWCSVKIKKKRRQSVKLKQENFKNSYMSDPKNVLPVRTAKQIALKMSLCWCNRGSKIRCSITPANTWYLQNK